MVVICSKCSVRYDDAVSWTICPHNVLDVAADAVLCRRCDIYVGYNNVFGRTGLETCLVCGRTAEEVAAA